MRRRVAASLRRFILSLASWLMESFRGFDVTLVLVGVLLILWELFWHEVWHASLALRGWISRNTLELPTYRYGLNFGYSLVLRVWSWCKRVPYNMSMMSCLVLAFANTSNTSSWHRRYWPRSWACMKMKSISTAWARVVWSWHLSKYWPRSWACMKMKYSVGVY